MAAPLSSSLPFRRGMALLCATRQCNHSLSSSYTFTTITSAPDRRPDPTHVNFQNAPEGFDVTSAVVYPNFLTEDESKSLVKEASRRLKRRRFENGHWDSVITDYREVEMSSPDIDFNNEHDISKDTGGSLPQFAKVIQETRRHLEAQTFTNSNDAISNNTQWLPCHAIDLSANGELSAHVDSVKFSGEVVCGLSLLSNAIMRLRPSSEEWDSEGQETRPRDSSGYVDLYLPRLSLYVLSGMSRYSYTHELLPSNSTFEYDGPMDSSNIGIKGKSVNVIRGRRLSIVFRDAHRSKL